MLLYASRRQSSICHHNGNSKARHAYPYLPVVISVISPSSSCRIWRRSRAAREEEEEEESFSSFSHRLISSVTKEGRRRREGEETGVGRLSSSSRRGILLYTYVYVCGDGGGKFTMCIAGTFMRICWPAVRSRAKTAYVVSWETFESTLISIKQN